MTTSIPGLQVLGIDQLPGDDDRELIGASHGVDISIILVNADTGIGPDLHRHDYPEIVVIIEGTMRATVGTTTVDLTAGHVAIIEPGQPHAFTNPGPGHLRSIDIHLNDKFATTWLNE